MFPTTSVRFSLLALLASMLVLPASGTAQDARLQLQQFRPMPSQTSNYFHVTRAETPDAGTWELGGVLNYSNDPLVVQTQAQGEALERTGKLVTQMLVLDALFAWSITDRFELGVALPIYLFEDGRSGQGFARFEIGERPNAGIGDIRIVPRLELTRFGGANRDNHVFGVSADVMLPTGGDNAYQGEALRAEFRASTDFNFGRVTLSPNVGWLARRQVDLGNIHAGHSFTYGAGAIVRLTNNESVFGLAEVTGLVSKERLSRAELQELPLETRIGARVFPQRRARGLMVEAGGGFGIIEGFGTPDFRLFAGATYQHRRAEEQGCYPSEYPDDDGDFVCETPDDFGAECDMCRPRLDGNYPESSEIAEFARREDAAHYWRYGYYADASTDDAIDVDGDGTPDACDICRPADACDPLYRTDDNVDADGDGIPDGCDYCPDGTDLTDTDGDCISDCLDQCPEEPELWNGEADEDGCPEAFACSMADVCPDNLNEFPIVDQVYGGVPFFFDYDVFWEFSELTMNGYDRETNQVLIAQMAAILVDLADCLDYRLLASGHTDTDGNAEYNEQLGLNRANHVRTQLVAALIEAGMDPSRAEGMVDAETSGESDPLNPDDPNDDYAVGNRENRRVILRIVGCGEIGERGPTSFEPVCPATTAGLRCGAGLAR